jgi:uncharacterized protein YdeI (YjbR/CyaY-like superfamily)
MKNMKTIYIKDRQAWRDWLEKNHDKKKEAWLLYYKKHTGKLRVEYLDAVKKALCYPSIYPKVRRLTSGT